MLTEKGDSKLLVVGHHKMYTHFINIDGKPVTEQQAVDYYAKQGIHFFLKNYRYVHTCIPYFLSVCASSLVIT